MKKIYAFNQVDKKNSSLNKNTIEKFKNIFAEDSKRLKKEFGIDFK